MGYAGRQCKFMSGTERRAPVSSQVRLHPPTDSADGTEFTCTEFTCTAIGLAGGHCWDGGRGAALRGQGGWTSIALLSREACGVSEAAALPSGGRSGAATVPPPRTENLPPPPAVLEMRAGPGVSWCRGSPAPSFPYLLRGLQKQKGKKTPTRKIQTFFHPPSPSPRCRCGSGRHPPHLRGCAAPRSRLSALPHRPRTSCPPPPAAPAPAPARVGGQGDTKWPVSAGAPAASGPPLRGAAAEQRRAALRPPPPPPGAPAAPPGKLSSVPRSPWSLGDRSFLPLPPMRLPLISSFPPRSPPLRRRAARPGAAAEL